MRPTSKRRTKYAKARIAAGLTYRALQSMGFGPSTIAKADKGQLPKHPAIREAYLSAIRSTK